MILSKHMAFRERENVNAAQLIEFTGWQCFPLKRSLAHILAILKTNHIHTAEDFVLYYFVIFLLLIIKVDTI